MSPKMAGNQEICNDHDNIITDAVTYNSSTSADGDRNHVLISDSHISDGLHDGASRFMPLLPVCTSTPLAERLSRKLFDSIVAFPKLDNTADSGLGDTFHSSPSLSGTATPSITETKPVTVSVCETGITATSTPSFASLAGDQHLPSENGLISSTPISQMLVGRQLTFSVERSQSFSDSPMTVSSFQSDFNLHRYSEGSISTGASSSTEHLACKDKLFRAHAVWHDDEDTDDDAYFSTSRVSLSVESPCGTDESSQGADLLQQWDRVFRDFSPTVPDRLIGRKMGVEFVDIIGELDERNVPATGVIAWLTPYLTPTDFLRMCGVCQRWRQICLQDKVIARIRKLCRRMYARPEEKENTIHSSVKCRSPEESGSLTRSSGCLGSVQQAVPAPTKVAFSSPALYEQARKTLRWEDIMRHCPQCHSVAKILSGQERGQCQNQRCQADFCTRCLASYHNSAPCPIITRRTRVEPTGSKKSKKNLRRISQL